MKKVQLYLPEKLIVKLKLEANDHGVSLSEIIRRYLDNALTIKR